MRQQFEFIVTISVDIEPVGHAVNPDEVALSREDFIAEMQKATAEVFSQQKPKKAKVARKPKATTRRKPVAKPKAKPVKAVSKKKSQNRLVPRKQRLQ